jgi:hypothetical protein
MLPEVADVVVSERLLVSSSAIYADGTAKARSHVTKMELSYRKRKFTQLKVDN